MILREVGSDKNVRKNKEYRGKKYTNLKCLDTEMYRSVFDAFFFPQELQFRVLDDLDVSRKRRPPLKYILSRTMGFWGSGSFFFLSSVPGFCPRFVPGSYTVRPRFVRAHLAPLVFTSSLYLQIQ